MMGFQYKLVDKERKYTNVGTYIMVAAHSSFREMTEKCRILYKTRETCKEKSLYLC